MPLLLVATPIGNLQDISARALAALAGADLIAAEDTRIARTRLQAWGIQNRALRSFWDQNEADQVPNLLEILRSGQTVALISDAGTPLISDPGYRLVQACIAEDLPVDILPGPCAAVAALPLTGLPTARFYFGGYLPREPGPRLRALTALQHLDATLLFHESPARLRETIQQLHSFWPARRVCVARNLTKPPRPDEAPRLLRGVPAAVLAMLEEEVHGEIILAVEGAPEQAEAPADLDAQLRQFLAAGRPMKEIRDLVAEQTGLPRREIYQRLLELTRGSQE